ncbi:hypothetical protein [Anaeromicrobium sediminis]|nr:hypothetical protein [Anaeromicrobium sediminis]
MAKPSKIESLELGKRVFELRDNGKNNVKSKYIVMKLQSLEDSSSI